MKQRLKECKRGWIHVLVTGSDTLAACGESMSYRRPPESTGAKARACNECCRLTGMRRG